MGRKATDLPVFIIKRLPLDLPMTIITSMINIKVYLKADIML